MLKYYHVGVDAGGSWSWYYPHLYAPLASSMTNLMDMEISFEKGRYVLVHSGLALVFIWGEEAVVHISVLKRFFFSREGGGAHVRDRCAALRIRICVLSSPGVGKKWRLKRSSVQPAPVLLAFGVRAGPVFAFLRV